MNPNSCPTNRIFPIPFIYERILRIIIPYFCLALYLILTYIILPSKLYTPLFILTWAYAVPPAGKESLIPIAISLGLPWWFIAPSLTFFDLIAAWVVVWNYDLICRLPIIGGIICGFIERSKEYIQCHPWLERLSFLGLVLFIAVPFQGNGGIGGAVIGIVLGLSSLEILGAICLGSLIHSFAIALSYEYASQYFAFDTTTALGVGLFMIILSIIISLGYRIQKKRRTVWKIRDKIRT